MQMAKPYKLILFFAICALFMTACKDAKINVKMKSSVKSTPAPATFQANSGAIVLNNGPYQMKSEIKGSSQVVLTNGPYSLQAEVVR